MTRHPIALASAVVILLTVFLMWPQPVYLSSKIAAHHDALFSTWRIEWIAHALRTDPRHLFDANIFYPEQRTLAYSDATLLEGAIAAPLLWAGVPAVAVYNLLLLAGIAASGFAMFVLARHLTRNDAAALGSATAFTVMPYRIEHVMHLELQWAMWMPLAFWAVHRAVDDRSWRFGALAGVLIWLQCLSCIYYGILLGMMAALLAILLVAADIRHGFKALVVFALGAIVAVSLTYPYARPYVENARELGGRDLGEIARLSATPISYLSTPSQNWLWGWTADFGAMELHLFPGAVTVCVALVALVYRSNRIVWTYAALCAIAVALSFGFNGWLFRALYAWFWLFHGLRAPARFSMAAYCTLAVLVGYGVANLQRALPRWKRVVAIASVTLIALESGSAPMGLTDVAGVAPDIYVAVDRLDNGVIAELPMPRPDRLPGNDPTYAFWSRAHWKPLVNGYSGYASSQYIVTLERMLTFPDGVSIKRLQSLDVRYIVVHEQLYDHPVLAELMIEIAKRDDLTPLGRYRDWLGHASLFELQR